MAFTLDYFSTKLRGKGPSGKPLGMGYFLLLQMDMLLTLTHLLLLPLSIHQTFDWVFSSCCVPVIIFALLAGPLPGFIYLAIHWRALKGPARWLLFSASSITLLAIWAGPVICWASPYFHF